MNNAALFFGLVFSLVACNDDKNYPGCGNTWWCDFEVSSWNQGSSNYWIYGSNTSAYYYFNGGLIGTEHVSISRARAENCVTFERDDILTWDGCDDNLIFNCGFIINAKIVFNRYSSSTARKDDKYPTVEGTEFDYDCAR